MIRVAKVGVFFTTPNRFFPIEMHTNIPIFHWFPKRFFDNLLKIIGKEWAAGNYMNLLSYNKLNKILKPYKKNNIIIIDKLKICFCTHSFCVKIVKGI